MVTRCLKVNGDCFGSWLLLVSHRQVWGGVDLIEYMHQKGYLGPETSQFGIIEGAHHTEFSDTCLLTPLWLARSVGVTGQRNPRDTAEEIKYRTVDFINTVRSKK